MVDVTKVVIAGVDQASETFGKITSASDKLRRSMEALAGVTVAGLGAASFVAWAKGALETLDRLNDLSKATGLTVENLSGLSLAARQSGTDLEGIAKSINMLSQNMGKEADRFSKLGISARDPLEAFKQLSDQFVAMQDPQQRAAVMAEVLGKNWQTAAPLLAEGGARIGEMVARGRDLSGASQQMAEQADALNDKWLELQGNGRTLMAVMGPMLPLFNATADGMLAASKGTTVWSVAGAALTEVLRAVIVFGGNLLYMLRAIGLEATGIATQLVALAHGDLKTFNDIHREMVADAEASREAIDKWSIAVLEAGTAAKATTVALDGMDQVQRRMASEAAARGRAYLQAAKDKQAADDAARKALAEAQRLQNLDNRGWVAKIDQQIEEYERGLGVMAADAATFYAGEDQLRKLDDAGWVAKIDQQVEEYERGLREMGDKQPSHLQTMEKQWDTLWSNVGDVAGNFFTDLAMHGRSAFNHLRDLVKQLLADMIGLFARRWILQLAGVASPGGGTLAGGLVDLATGGSGGLLGNGLGLAGGASSFFTGVGLGIGEAGTAATLVGPPVTAAGGSLGAGAMVGDWMAGLSATGWGLIIVAAVAVIAAFMGGRGGGPKTGGSFFSGGAVPGTDNGRFFTPNQGDAQVQGLVTATTASFLNVLHGLGGTGGQGFNFGLGFDNDPSGSAQSRVSSLVTDPTGRSIYGVRDLGMDDKDVPSALQLESKRMILAALQTSDLPKDIADILNSITASTATSDQIDQVIAKAKEMKAVLDALGHMDWGNLTVAGLKAMALEGETIGQTFQRVAGAMAAFDNAFLSSAQKYDLAMSHVTTVFNALGIAIPRNTAELVAFVHGLDLSTTAGQHFFTMIMSVFPDLQVIFNQTDTAVTNLTDSAQNLVDVSSKLPSETAKAMIDAQRSLGNFLNGLLQDPNLSPLSLQERFNVAKGTYDKASGMMNTPDQVQAAETAAQQYLGIAKQLLGGPEYTAVFQSVYEKLGAKALGAQSFQDAFNAALPASGAKMASSNDIRGLSRDITNLILAIRDGDKEERDAIVTRIERSNHEVAEAIKGSPFGSS